MLKISPHSNLGMPVLVSSQSSPDTGTGVKKLKLGYVPGLLCTASGVEHLRRREQPALVWSSERGRITCYGSPLIEGSSPTLKKAGKHKETGTEGKG